jgi:anti-sigma regulatory factor (Ser/Thr protein kinase)
MICWLLESRKQHREWAEQALQAENFEVWTCPGLARLNQRMSQASADVVLVSEAHAQRPSLLQVAESAGLVQSGWVRLGQHLYHWRLRLGAPKNLLSRLRKMGEFAEAKGNEASLHEHYRKLLNRVSDGILDLDSQDLIRWGNSSLQKALSVEDLTGLSLEQIVKPSDVAQLRMLRRQHSAGVVAAVPVSLVNGQVVELDPNVRLASDGKVMGSSLVLKGIRSTQESDRGRELFVLYTVATLLSQASNLEQALESVLQRSMELLDLAAAGCQLSSGSGGQPRGLKLEPEVLAIIDGLCQRTVRERKSIIYRHLQRESEGQLLQLKQAGVLGLAIVPLQVGGQLTGCLWFVSTDPGHFSREVVSLLISLSIPLAVAAENFRHVEDKLQEEAHRRQFYRDALHAVTRGKLFLCEPDELAEVWSRAGDSAGERVIRSYADVPELRKFVEGTLVSEGFTEERCHDMALCATEAAGNVVKHAESGRLEIRVLGEDAWILIEDKGPGISFSNLPSAVLTAGFSTAPSLGMGYSILLEMADSLYLSTTTLGTSVLMQISRKEVDPLAAFAAFEML